MIDWQKTYQEFSIDQSNYKFDSTVIVKCDSCGTYRHKKIRSKKNVVNGQMPWKCMSCCLNNPATKSKKSVVSKKIWAKNRDKIINSIDYSKVSAKSKKNWQNEEYKNKILCSIKKNAPIHSKRMKKKWQNKEYRNKMMKIYSTSEWSELRSQIANEAWNNDDYRNCVLSHIEKRKITKEEFLKRAADLYGDRYDYSEIDYQSYNDRIKIICNKHGAFWQVPSFHIKSSCGCPVCAGTHLQAEIFEFVGGLCDNVVNNDRSHIAPNELDIFMPDKGLAIEVNGMYWHSFDHLETNEERNKHVHKLQKCEDNNIRLIQIAEYEWLDKRQIVESIIRNKIGKSDKIYARQCQLKQIDTKTYRKFINANHLQGYNHSHVIYGLEYNNELVSVMSFNKHKKYGWEITRFANKIGIAVIGGASKLFKKFLGDINPGQVLTYADRRYSSGDLYKKLGFCLVGVTRPNYVYIKGSNYYSRQQFQKHKLKNKLESFDPSFTEAENMFNNGYRRMWDAGHHKFIWSGDKNTK